LADGSAGNPRSDVFGASASALSAGVRAIQDPFTYKAAFAAVTPVLLVGLFGFLALRERIASPSGFYYDYRDFADLLSGWGLPSVIAELLAASAVWGLLFLIALVTSIMWFNIAIGMRAVTKERGADLAVADLLKKAAGRLLPVLGAQVLLILMGAGVWLITFILAELAQVAFLSFVVALLTIPLALIWISLVLTVIIGAAYLPGVAASRSGEGPVGIIRRSVGISLAYPAPALLMLIAAVLTALITFALLGFAFETARRLAVFPIVEQMIGGGHGWSESIATIQVIALGLMVVMAPYAVTAGAIAAFDDKLGDDPAVEAAPTRLLGVGWLGLRRAVGSTGAAFGKLKSRLDASAQQVASQQGADSSTSDTPPDSDSDAPDDAAPGPFSCAQCGTEHAEEFKYCRECGTAASG